MSEMFFLGTSYMIAHPLDNVQSGPAISTLSTVTAILARLNLYAYSLSFSIRVDVVPQVSHRIPNASPKNNIQIT